MLKHAGLRQTEDSPVCSNELSGFIDPDDFSRWRRKFFVKEGLAHYTKEEKYVDRRGIERVRRTGYVGPNFHALRHAQATLLVAGGIDPKTVQARLGHESLNTTLNIYAEEVAENDKKAADFMGGLLNATE
jgi:integrase